METSGRAMRSFGKTLSIFARARRQYRSLPSTKFASSYRKLKIYAQVCWEEGLGYDEGTKGRMMTNASNVTKIGRFIFSRSTREPKLDTCEQEQKIPLWNSHLTGES